jgi:phage baseplate assembly protein gpV
MTDELAPPSRDPANDGTLTGMLREVMGKMTQGLDDCLPAVVVAFDRTSNRATVKPMVQVLTTKGEAVSRAQLVSVPVFQIGGGGFILNFNLKPGDLGWIKASDRDTSLFLQQYSEQKPNTKRLHSFSDGLFFPDVMRGYTINGEDAENAVLQTLDGACRVAIWPDRVKITAPQVIVDAPETLITGNATINGNLQVDGTIHADGNIDSDATITGDSDVVSGAIHLRTHKHTGVTIGFSNSGGPTP